MRKFEGIRGRNAAQANARIYIRATRMYLRGLLTRPFLKRSGGPVYRGRHVDLTGAQYISHSGPMVIEDFAEIQGLSKNGLVFGAGVSVGRGTSIRPSSYYGGLVGEGMSVGDRSSFATGCFIGCSGQIVIGSDVMIGPGVRIFSENHIFDSVAMPIKEQGVARAQVVIEDDCWIGSGATITSGVRIGAGTVVAAGSVVIRDVPPRSVVAGVPARVIRSRDSS